MFWGLFPVKCPPHLWWLCSQVALLHFSVLLLCSPAVHINGQKVLKPSSLSLLLPNPSLCLHCRSQNMNTAHILEDEGIWMKKNTRHMLFFFPYRKLNANPIITLNVCLLSCTWIVRNMSYMWNSANHATQDWPTSLQIPNKHKLMEEFNCC